MIILSGLTSVKRSLFFVSKVIKCNGTSDLFRDERYRGRFYLILRKTPSRERDLNLNLPC